MYCIICGYPVGQKKKCPRCIENKKYIPGKCEYCTSIYESTPASHRRKYLFCPMCGTRLDKNKFKHRRLK